MAFGGENAESYYDEGLTASMKGDVHRAIQCFMRTLQLDKSFHVAYHQLGKCYLRLGQADKAVEYLKHVVGRRPELVPAKVDLGYALLQAGLADEARRQFAEVQGLQPNNPRGHLGMGHVLFQQGDWAGAVDAAMRARVNGGSNFTVLFLLGRAAKLAGHQAIADETLEEAEALIEKSIELSPEQAEGYYLRGEVCFAQERFSNALDHYRAAEDRAELNRYYAAFGENFTRLDIMVKRGLCLQRMGQLDAAREMGERILAQAPDHKLGKVLKGL